MFNTKYTTLIQSNTTQVYFSSTGYPRMNATCFDPILGYPQACLCCVTLNTCGLFTLLQGSDDSTVQYSTIQCSAVQCSAVQCSTVQYSTVQYSTVQCSAVQCSAVQCSTVQCSTGLSKKMDGI